MTRETIDSILLWDWDPIGIADISLARDEYQNYTKTLQSLLAQRAQKEMIAQILVEIERNEMGLTGDLPRALRVAEKLLKLKPWASA
jgi:regulator of sirC expression with transglutaminase-like and TPR domain